MDLLRKLLAGASRLTMAPENDGGAAYEDDAPGADDELDDLDEGDDEDDGVGDDLDGADLDADDDDEGSGAAGGQQQQTQQRRPPASAQFGAMRRENRELKERLERIERQQTQQPQQPRVTAEQRQAYLDSLDPDQRTQFLLNEQGQHFEARLNAIAFQSQDSADRTAFEALCARTPAAAAVKDKVEQRLQEMRANGTTAPRETVLRWVLGDLALARAGRAGGKQRKAAEQQRQRQTARPTSGRGDVTENSGRRGSEAEQRRKRLEGMQI